jgi:tetratricopeptide (TPR) repeat protein
MNHSENDITLVEKYFDAELNDSEKKLFTDRVDNDENFRSLVEEERVLIGAIRYQGIGDNLQYLKALESSIQDQQKFSISRISRNWYYVAAAAVIGILLLSKVMVSTFSPTPDQLFQAYFAPYPNMFEPTVRGNDNASLSPKTEAFQAYEQRDYARAVVLFNELRVTKEEAGVLLLLGNANLILGDIEAAKENFTTLNKEFDELDMQAKWYLSLCFLKSGDMKQAKAILKELGDTEISYATRARELLKKVN